MTLDQDMEELTRFNGRNVDAYLDHYLSTYIIKVEQELKQMGIEVSRENITGKIIEKLAEQKIQTLGIDSEFRLLPSYGEKQEIAQEILIEKRRFYSFKQRDPKEEQRKQEEKEYLMSLTPNERMKYRINKFRSIISLKNIKQSIYNGVGSYRDYILLLLCVIHFTMVIHSFIVGSILFNTGIASLLSGDPYYLNQYLLNRYMYYGKSESWILSLSFIVGIYILSALIFRTSIIRQSHYAFFTSKWIKRGFIGAIYYYLTSSLYFVIGTFYSTKGETLHLASYNLVRNIVILFLVLFIFSGFITMRYLKLIDPMKISRDKGGMNHYMLLLVYKIVHTPLLLFQYLILIVVLIYGLINSYELIWTLIRGYVNFNSGILDIGLTYNVAWITLLIFSFYQLMIKHLDPDTSNKVWKRNRIILWMQLVVGSLYNIYIMLTVYYAIRSGYLIQERLSNVITKSTFYILVHGVFLWLNTRSRKVSHINGGMSHEP